MHSRWGVPAGWALLIAYIGTAAAGSAGGPTYTNVILHDRFGMHIVSCLFTAGLSVFASFLAYRHIQISARLMLWLCAASVTLISVIAAGIILKHGWHSDMTQLALRGVTAEKLRLGLVLAMFSSVGFESATSLGAEARDPLTSIPRAVKWSAILAGVFFFLCAYAEVLGFHGESVTLDENPAPLHVFTEQLGPPTLGRSPIWARF
jgi:amino acid transporter